MDASQDFKSLQEKIQSSLVATTRTVNGLANEDLSFQRTVNPLTSARLDATSERLLRLAGDVLKSAGKFTGQTVPSIEDADDVDISWKGILDVVDSLLEKTDTCLDEYTGLVKRKDVPAAESGPAPKRPKTNDRLEWSMKRANIIKPQNGFERKVDNYDTGPWRPLLTTKPHATVPLKQSLGTLVDEEHQTQYKHPYETEIQEVKYPARVYEKADPINYLPVETTSATWVDTYDQVLEMLEELKKAKEIAVDLEHHDFRSYPGLLSLMQISTRERDWIVDTLQPWRHKLEILNEVFTDPNIVKVFHGAFMDVIWLQRDLGLYVVGLFDTHYASTALGYPGRSLAYLLQRFVDFDADKKYQMADWRIRPLPEEMLYYARSDTHYLLYIYDMVRNELIERSASGDSEKDVEWVVQKSKEVSLQRYETPICDVETGQGSRGWFNMLAKSPSLLSREQFSVYRAVHKWRDDMARLHDESPAYIMSQRNLADVARMMPSDPKALWSLLHKDSQVIKSRLDELFAVVKEAKDRGVNGPSMMDFLRGDSMGAVAKNVFGDLRRQKDKGDQAIPDAKELRSERSQLWGTVPLSSVWDGSKPSPSPADASEISLPWTIYVQDKIYAGTTAADANDQVEARQPEEAVPSANNANEAAAAEDDGFTLKSGRKRNVEEVNSDSDSESEPSAEAAESESESKQGGVDDSVSDEEAQAKAQRKKARKESRKASKEAKAAEKAELKAQKAARKAARKAAKAAGSEPEASEPSGEAEDQPFDYSKAQSVLHAQRANGGRATSSRVFDPYVAKTGGDGGLKGARNMNYQKPGKTATFKK